MSASSSSSKMLSDSSSFQYVSSSSTTASRSRVLLVPCALGGRRAEVSGDKPYLARKTSKTPKKKSMV